MISRLKERWSEYKLNAHQRPKLQYEYFVTGRGDFPFDMLRHDAAWPASSEDAAKLDLSFLAEKRALRSIRMRSYRMPTIDRWSSFGWSVGTEKLP